MALFDVNDSLDSDLFRVVLECLGFCIVFCLTFFYVVKL